MIKFTKRGDFSKLSSYLQKRLSNDKRTKFDKYGRMGVEALREATPKDTGRTSESWSYDIMADDSRISITWSNSNFNNGVPIAVVLQYGHATSSGGWVEGRDYINPALQPVFDKILEKLRKETSEV